MKNIKFKRYISYLLSSILFSCCSTAGMESKDSYLNMSYGIDFKNKFFSKIPCSKDISDPALKKVIMYSWSIRNKKKDMYWTEPLDYGNNGGIFAYFENGEISKDKIVKLTNTRKNNKQELSAIEKLLKERESIIKAGFADNIVNIVKYDLEPAKSKKNKNRNYDTCIYMKYIDGVTFEKFLSNLKCQKLFCPFSETLKWMLRVCETLIFLKNKEIFYFDLHTDNIMLHKNKNNEFCPILIDVGGMWTKKSLDDSNSDFNKIESSTIGDIKTILEECYENKNITEKDKITYFDIENLKNCETFEELVESMKKLIEKCK